MMASGGHDIERRDRRIAEGAVGAFGVGPLPAQNKQAEDRQHVENQHGEDHVIEQVAVEIAVGDCAGCWDLPGGFALERAGPPRCLGRPSPEKARARR